MLGKMFFMLYFSKGKFNDKGMDTVLLKML